MHSNEKRIGRGKAFFIGLGLNLFLWGVWFFGVVELNEIYIGVVRHADAITINLIGLWVPIGLFGVCVVFLTQTFVTVITGIKAYFFISSGWRSFFDGFMLFFAFSGVIGGVYIYQITTERLSVQGYTYCKQLSRFTAMGRHEVYVASPELCVNPSKIR